MKLKPIITLSLLAVMVAPATIAAKGAVKLEAGPTSLSWKKTADGWRLEKFSRRNKVVKLPSALHYILYSAQKPSTDHLDAEIFGGDPAFPGEEYRYITPSWHEATSSVALNRAGEAREFLPQQLKKDDDNTLSLSYSGGDFDISEVWRADDSGDIRVSVTLTAKKEGWYSIATPPIMVLQEDQLDFAIIPGVLHGHRLSADFDHAYAYAWDIPNLPVLFRERSASTLSSILTSRNGLTVAVTAEPGTGAEPWGTDKRNDKAWRLGLSAINRQGELSPTLYHPVLGEEDSFMKSNESRTFSFRYSFGDKGWWPVFNHVARDIYSFSETLSLRKNRRSLTDRLYGIYRYVVNDSTSKWHTYECNGVEIGAQEYLGGVYKANKDAVKNADYGAMWMLGTLTGDTLLTRKRMPYALNFKLQQQYDSISDMAGASRGQYYLSRGKCFVEEWGPYTEPIATTYYMLSDLGNIYLFEPENLDLVKAIRSAADWLISRQKADGSWAVAYNDQSGEEAFTDLYDYRPTFYGLIIAYRTTGDEKYLKAAEKGAAWLIDNAVYKHRWLGVCGDTRFAPDFATAQAAQALMELYEITGDRKYLDAAVETARFYTTSIYTSPVASGRPVKVKGKDLEQWQINTAGLSYEHGGIIGSTNLHGPILLPSHAGMFMRMAKLTGDNLFADMARAAAIGRDAFVDDKTAVASYYWNAMNRGAGPYPHHAWWQMGWITDYLISELEFRSKGEISFPAGFITPKVGPHRSYGFAPGKVFSEEASLMMVPDAVICDNPNVEVIMARSADNLWLLILNDCNHELNANLKIDLDSLGCINADNKFSVNLPSYGLETIKLPLKK